MNQYQTWPLGKLPIELQRPELALLKQAGYQWNDDYEVVELFEQKVADFADAKYGIAVDCCSHGLFLCLKYLGATGTVVIPKNTYVSVPLQIAHAGCNVQFDDIKWSGRYKLNPYPIYDAAVRWCENMYTDGLHVISFQLKKRIPIGRGGMILTDDKDAALWLKRARHDGRDMSVFYVNDTFSVMGWHYYMTPEDAARGILLMDAISGSYPDSASYKNYIDLSTKLKL